MTFRNEPLPKALLRIEKQSSYKFVFAYEDVEPYRVNGHVRNASVTEAVRYVLRKTPLTFTLDGKIINVVVRSPQSSKQADSREQSFSGHVYDVETREPIIGAQVRVRGTKAIAITDANGDFTLRCSCPVGSKAEFIYLGMKTVVATLRDNMKVGMRSEANTLDDVVVTGYQQLDRRNLTSSITSMKMEDLEIAGASTLDKMLQGRIPDMVVTNSSGEINSVPKIRIRGTSTLIGNREPLWVVDGVIVNDPVDLSADVINDPDYINRIGNAISGINPQDIERIDVLKDAAATALYGTRAANGIIVITTKKGRVGKPVVSYSFDGTYRRRPRYTDEKIDLMNSLERTQVSRELVESHYVFPSDMASVGYEDAIQKYYSGVYTRSEFENMVAKYETQNTDWFDLLCRDTFSASHAVNISGGNDKMRYYASLGYTGEDDVVKGNSNTRYTAATNLDFSITPKFQAALQLSAYRNKRDYNQDDVSPIDYAYRTSRVIPAYNEDGSYYFYDKGGTNGNYQYNILNEIDNSYKKQTVDGLNATLNLHYYVTDWFFLNSVLSYATTDTNIEGWYGEDSYYAQSLRGVASEPQNSMMPFGGELSENDVRTKSYTARLQANFNKYFGEEKAHNINFIAGVEANSVRYNGNSYTQRGYYKDRGKKFITNVPSEYTSYINWLTTNMPTITDTRTNLLSAYASLSYSFKDLFTLNANGRYDGSNKFGDRSNDKILPVWSVSGNANIKRLTGLKAKWVDALTLKLSYGGQGNMLDGQTPVMTLTKGSYDTHYNEMVSTVNAFANPDLKWEKTHSFNTGIETSLFNGRLMAEVEYYYKKTTDAFMNKTISDINGYTSYVVNSGEIINQGYNISITSVPVRIKDFNWMLSGSFSKVFNRINTAPGMDTYELSDYLNGTAIVRGEPVGTFYSYRFIGLNPEDGGPLFDDWEDRSDELIGLSKAETFTTVLEASGKRDPDISGNVNNTFSWKGFRLGILFNFSMGNKVRLFRIYDQGGSGVSPATIYPEYNLNRAVLNRWKQPGDELTTNIPSIISTSDPNYYKYSTHWSSGSNYQGVTLATDSWTMYDYSNIRVVSGDYVRLANISLTYELPQSLLEKWHAQRIAITLSGTNLHTWCSKELKGQTPTQSGFATVQLGDTPYYSLSLNVQF
ncbi:MAG: SusC/RagA family TonB-linked outer membrane protein [Prevotella sp.]